MRRSVGRVYHCGPEARAVAGLPSRLETLREQSEWYAVGNRKWGDLRIHWLELVVMFQRSENMSKTKRQPGILSILTGG